MNLRYSEKGEFMGSTAGDRTARIWDTKTYRQVGSFTNIRKSGFWVEGIARGYMSNLKT